MEIQIQAGTTALNATVIRAEGSRECVLFLSGGSLTVGKERYHEWQEGLATAGISSVSFDYSGVNGSGIPLAESSLKSRIEEAAHVTDWMTEQMPAHRHVLYGASMGGYIALGLIQEKPDVFDALILHAPAAYARSVHNVPFGKGFTDEIRKEGSWRDSHSFEWLRMYEHPVLLIESEKDEVIPSPVIHKYKEVKKDGGLSLFILKDAPHGIWGDSEEDTNFRYAIYQEFERFIRPNPNEGGNREQQ